MVDINNILASLLGGSKDEEDTKKKNDFLSILPGLTNIAGGLISGGNSTGVGNLASSIGGVVGTVNPILGAGLSAAGSLINGAFGSDINKEAVNQVESNIQSQGNITSTASTTDDFLSDIGNYSDLAHISKSDIGSDGWFSNKASKTAKRLNNQIDEANKRAGLNFMNTASNVNEMGIDNALANFMAAGGNTKSPGPIFNPFTKEWMLDGKPMRKRYDKKWGYTEYSDDGFAINYNKKGVEIGRRKGTQTPSITGKNRNEEEQKYFDRDKEFTDSVKVIADRYGISPNLLASRLAREGVDKAIEYYNYSGGNRLVSDDIDDDLYKVYASGPLWGLDWFADDVEKGKAVLKEPWVNYRETSFINEHDIVTRSAVFDKWSDAISATAAELKGRRDRLQKLYPNLSGTTLDAAAAGSFNLGETGVKRAIRNGSISEYTPFINIHADGGDLKSGDFSNGVSFINNGGTHEQNPNEGVQLGTDDKGIPNLVEEGEVVWKDYVFSNRMKVPKSIRNKYKLRGNKLMTFADAAKVMQKESEERPNDPISKRGLEDSLTKLQQVQESIRQQNQAGQEGIQYAHGGKMGMLFDGLGDTPNFLGGMDYGDGQDYGTLLEPINAEDLLNEAMAGTKGTKGNTNSSSKLTWLRYAPVAGAAIGLGQNLFSRPDYTSADTILEAANQAGSYTPVDYTPIGNYLQYRPFDRNFYTNKLNAQAGATRRAIMNTASPSRGAALLAADYNAQGRLGDLARQAEEYNLAQRQAVETFNRGTDMSNAEMGLKAAMANQEAALKAKSSRLSGVAQAMSVRDAVDARRGAGVSANLTNLFDSLGNIGIDAYNRADRDMLIKSGVFGTLSQKPQEWSDKRWKDYKKALKGDGYSKAKGGKLKKRRGGITY